MNSISISLIVFACAIGGALIGLLPPPHLSGDSKELVRLGMGLIATMTAILLGLLIASAKTFYEHAKQRAHRDVRQGHFT